MNLLEKLLIYKGLTKKGSTPTSDYNVKTKTTITSAEFVTSIEEIKEINLSNRLTSTRNMFSYFSSLTEVPLFDTSNISDMQSMFSNCSSLTSIPLFNTSNVTRMKSMFSNCTSLTSVPLFNTSNVIDMNNMFGQCRLLTDESLDNILQMCINAKNYTATKTFQGVGFNVNNYPASRIQGLPHYQDFIDAGWTIGY